MAHVGDIVMKFPSEECRKRSMAFECMPDDFLICTSPKCGTTLMQQIVHTLRTGGDDTFEEISLVVPFIELAYDYGIGDLDAHPQPGCMRGFKTHRCMPFTSLVEGTKCIYVARNPQDVATSFFHFFEGWIFDEGTVQVDEFVEHFFMERGKPTAAGQPCTIWHHFLACHPHRSDPNYLFLFYEDLVQHKEKCVKLVAEFLNIELTQQLLEVTMSQSDHKAMALHPSKYDDHPVKLRRNGAMGRPRYAGVCNASGSASCTQGKVRAPGKCKAQLSEKTAAKLQAAWESIMAPETGCKTYEGFHEKVNAELGRPFAALEAAKLDG